MLVELDLIHGLCHSPGLQRCIEAVCFSIWQRHHSYSLLGQKRL